MHSIPGYFVELQKYVALIFIFQLLYETKPMNTDINHEYHLAFEFEGKCKMRLSYVYIIMTSKAVDVLFLAWRKILGWWMSFVEERIKGNALLPLSVNQRFSFKNLKVHKFAFTNQYKRWKLFSLSLIMIWLFALSSDIVVAKT